MNIHHYHPETQLYLGAEPAEADLMLTDTPDPQNPDHWLIPAYATLTEPPEIGQNQQAVWDGAAWRIEDIPPPPPEPAPPPEPTLAERREAMIIRIKTEAHYRIEDAMPTWQVIRSLTGGSPVAAGLQGEAQRIRQASDRLEAQVNAMDAETLDGFNPFDDQYWTPPEE